MKIKKGIGVCPGVAIAPAVVIDTEDFDIPQRHIPTDHAQAEIARLKNAVHVSKAELLDLQKRTVERIGKEAASIFDFHLGLLSDKILQSKFTDTITGGHVTAEYAVATVLRGYAKEFLAMPQYLAERVKDVYDIEKRLLRNLTGQRKQSLGHLRQDVVVLAHDMTPSQTAGMDRKHILGMAIDAGGPTSHTAIVARAMGIPTVVSLSDVSSEAAGGDIVIIDGNRGLVILQPDAKTINEYARLGQEQVEFAHSLDVLRELPAETKDGHVISLLGNIEFPDEAEKVIEKGGQGIGLYRTEFLYLGSDREPTEEDQYKAYRQVLERFKGRTVVIRTLDLGADKYTQSRARSPERNPMLGCRSIRLCLQNIPMFKTQLRALLRAAVHGDAWIMFPLISSIPEFRQAKAVLKDVAEDLEEENIAYRADMPVGMMVETPSAALMADTFAKEVDFFSIGTNDLIQYTLAVDRGNEKVSSLFTPTNPAVIRLIAEVIKAAHRHRIDVSLCGEMGANPEYTLLLLGLGLEKFSCSPPSIPEIKKIIRSVTLSQARKVAQRVMDLDSETEITNYLRSQTRRIFPEAYMEP
ncbi:MAG: phosphoenolpyruvate--protein phosphotransferase [Planctomycetes bacterium]|nr:phosphoenolpyruvate--protein phosphotransferase [Planctomycetota bacterium]